MRRSTLLAAAVLLCTPTLSMAFTITPTFLNNSAQTWTANEEAVVNEAISDWESVLSYTASPQNINMTFQFTAAGSGGYLGLWQGGYNATTGANLFPWSPQVTHTVNVNTDLMVARGPTFPDTITLAFTNGSTAVDPNTWDALSVLRHELGHALGLNTLYTDSAGTAGAGDKLTDHVTITGSNAVFDQTPGGLNIQLYSSTNISHVADTNDLMSVSLLNGSRKNISFSDMEELSLAYGYALNITNGTDFGPYTTSTFKTQTITMNGTVHVTSTAATRNTTATVLQTKNITFGASGLLDLSNHDLIISGGQTLASVRSLVASGLGTGTWNGTQGITSSTAAADGTTFGYATAGSLGVSTFDGLPVVSTDILVKYTYLGDATLDGKVDLNDLNTVLNNLGTTSSLWINGNFDGAATIDLNDLNDVLNHLGVVVPTNVSAVSVATALLAGFTPSAAPEPASLSVLAMGGGMLLRRRMARGVRA